MTTTDAEDPTSNPDPSDNMPEFSLPVDEHGKATKIQIFSIRRPHMRAFHFAWFSFFLAFFGWFALAPLQKKIRDNEEDTPWLNKGNFKTQNIIAVAGTILMRLIIGPFCDRFGPRIAQSLLLGVFSLPVFLVGTAGSFWQWTTARFFIGFIGAAFVVTQFWTSIMFSGNVVGTANATSAGWGNLGGGVTQAIMPQIFNLMKVFGASEDKAWRFAMIVPGVALILTSVSMYLLTDDLPHGQYADLHRAGKKEKTNPFVAMGRAATNWRVWILFILYAGCFGVELVMNGILATYFSASEEGFELDQGKAGLVASLFGLMNLFARSLGGIFSDILAHRYGMRGRLWAFFVVQLANGCCFVLFSRIKVIGGAIPILVLFSLFVQMAEGCTFGIVPFVDPSSTGSVSGIVGAGGNAGAVIGNLFLSTDVKDGIKDGFRNIGFMVIGSSFLIAVLWWPQYGSMFTKPTVKADVIDDAEESEDVEKVEA